MMRGKKPLRGVVSSAVVIVIVVVAGIGISYFPELRKPDINVMRTYRLSRVTDDQLRAAHQRAAAEAEKQRAADAAYEKKSRADLIAKLAECNANMVDPAFRARHPTGCMPPETFSSPFSEPTADSIFEDMIIGPCQFVRTVHDARDVGCLPPRSFWHQILGGIDR